LAMSAAAQAGEGLAAGSVAIPIAHKLKEAQERGNPAYDDRPEPEQKDDSNE